MEVQCLKTTLALKVFVAIYDSGYGRVMFDSAQTHNIYHDIGR